MSASPALSSRVHPNMCQVYDYFADDTAECDL